MGASLEVEEETMKNDRCKHELIVGTCATCLGVDHVPVPDPFEDVAGEVAAMEMDPEKDIVMKGSKDDDTARYRGTKR